ncbi:hypothetical protein A1O1_02131, partial [Capronia coronata CBS 617.96]
QVPTILLTVLLGIVVLSLAQSNCGTNQNPYCAGNSVFEQLCCPYPDVCYWQNRDGAPGCCPQGQVCNGQAYNPPTTVHPTTITITSSTSETTPTSTLHSTVTTFVNGGGGVIVTTQPSVVTVTTGILGGGVYSTVTSGVVGVYSTVTSAVVGVYSTVTSELGQGYATVSGVLVGAAPRSQYLAVTFPVMAAVFILAWHNIG